MKEAIGSCYVIVLFRTFVDANDPADIKVANALQDKIAVRQKNLGKFEIPDWDEASLKKVHNAINVLAATRTSAKGMFGDKVKLNPISHLLGTAFGWGGNPEEASRVGVTRQSIIKVWLAERLENLAAKKALHRTSR